jgi:hypothetical protein
MLCGWKQAGLKAPSLMSMIYSGQPKRQTTLARFNLYLGDISLATRETINMYCDKFDIPVYTLDDATICKRYFPRIVLDKDGIIFVDGSGELEVKSFIASLCMSTNFNTLNWNMGQEWKEWHHSKWSMPKLVAPATTQSDAFLQHIQRKEWDELNRMLKPVDAATIHTLCTDGDALMIHCALLKEKNLRHCPAVQADMLDALAAKNAYAAIEAIINARQEQGFDPIAYAIQRHNYRLLQYFIYVGWGTQMHGLGTNYSLMAANLGDIMTIRIMSDAWLLDRRPSAAILRAAVHSKSMACVQLILNNRYGETLTDERAVTTHEDVPCLRTAEVPDFMSAVKQAIEDRQPQPMAFLLNWLLEYHYCMFNIHLITDDQLKDATSQPEGCPTVWMRPKESVYVYETHAFIDEMWAAQEHDEATTAPIHSSPATTTNVELLPASMRCLFNAITWALEYNAYQCLWWLVHTPRFKLFAPAIVADVLAQVEARKWSTMAATMKPTATAHEDDNSRIMQAITHHNYCALSLAAADSDADFAMPLIAAAAQDDAMALAIMLQYTRRAHTEQYGRLVAAHPEYVTSPLIEAVSAGTLVCVQQLLHAAFDPSATPAPVAGTSRAINAIQRAIEVDNVQMMVFFIDLATGRAQCQSLDALVSPEQMAAATSSWPVGCMWQRPKASAYIYMSREKIDTCRSAQAHDFQTKRDTIAIDEPLDPFKPTGTLLVDTIKYAITTRSYKCLWWLLDNEYTTPCRATAEWGRIVDQIGKLHWATLHMMAQGTTQRFALRIMGC